jgi:hypothetical protein
LACHGNMVADGGLVFNAPYLGDRAAKKSTLLIF